MSINEDFRTLNNHSAWTGRTYVPPSTIVHHLDDMSIMAGTIGGLGHGTGSGQDSGSDADFTGRESGTNWEGETPTMEEIPSSEYTGGLKP